MTFITLNLFSGKDRPVTSISVPVMSLSDYHDKLSCFARKRTSREAPIGSRHNIVCREIFQKFQKEIFFLPCGRGKNVSFEQVLLEKVFFLKGVYSWNFILIFTPEVESKGPLFLTKPARFRQQEKYPEGASSASPFSLSASCASILVSEHGYIAKDSEGKLFLQGITVSFLQTPRNKGKSVFVQRRDIFSSPSPPLREEDLSSLEPRTCKFIKVSCFCRQNNFSYSTYFPVLTPAEVQKKLNNNQKKRLEKYGASSFKYKKSDTNQKVSKKESSKPLLVVLPPVMEVDVPFGPCREGELFFSYSDQFSLNLQLIFFPHLFEANQILPRQKRQCVDNWHIKKVFPLVKYCQLISATVFSFQGVKLVPFSASEYITTGMKIELISAPKGNFWGVFCSPEKKIHFSASSSNSTESIDSPERKMPLSASSSNSTESIDSPEREMPLDSPTPVISGLGYRKPDASLSQSTVTISISPERQGQQTQKKRKSPIPGPSGIGRRKPTASLVQPTSTVFASLERGRQHTQQRGIRSLFPGPFGVRHGPLPFCGDRSSIVPHSQATATVSVLSDRQGQQTQQRSRSPVPGSFEVSFYPYPQYGPWSFSGGFCSYGSSLPSYPHPSARQGQWMPVFPTSSFAVRPPVAALELRYDIPVQEGVGHSERAEEASAAVPVGEVQQIPIWRPYEESSSAEIFPQAQAENSDEDTDIDIEN